MAMLVNYLLRENGLRPLGPQDQTVEVGGLGGVANPSGAIFPTRSAKLEITVIDIGQELYITFGLLDA